MKGNGATSHPVDCIVPEDTRAQTFSFVVRIWKQVGTAGGKCRGWVEHVQSRKRTPFLGLDQLLSIIAAYVDIPTPEQERRQNRPATWQDRIARWFTR
jgi:hypothetical protein